MIVLTDYAVSYFLVFSLLMFSVTCQELAPFLVLAKSVINSHLRSRFPTIASYRHFEVHPRLLLYCEMQVVLPCLRNSYTCSIVYALCGLFKNNFLYIYILFYVITHAHQNQLLQWTNVV